MAVRTKKRSPGVRVTSKKAARVDPRAMAKALGAEPVPPGWTPPGTGPSELVQTRISYAAKLSLETKAEGSALTVSAYVRQLLYRDLGLIKGDSNG